MNKNFLYGAGILTASAGVIALYVKINDTLDALEKARERMAEEQERKRQQYVLVMKSVGATAAISLIAFLGFKLKSIVTNSLKN
jgi:hypothetical protein